MSFILRRLAFYLVGLLRRGDDQFPDPAADAGQSDRHHVLARPSDALPPEAATALVKTFGFAAGPLHEQFLAYLKSVFTWDLGYSIKFYPLTVTEVLGRALPWTVLLAGTSAMLAFSRRLAARHHRGVAARQPVRLHRLAWRAGDAGDPGGRGGAATLFVFGVALRWLPTGYAFDPSLDPGWTWHIHRQRRSTTLSCRSPRSPSSISAATSSPCATT